MKKSFFAATSYIFYGNKVLLIKHPKIGKWLPVGGKVDLGESPDEAVLREIYEEVGLEVDIIKKNRSFTQKIDTIQYVQNEDLGSKYHIDFIYYSKAKTDKFKLENEINEAKWFDYQDYLEIKDELFDDVKEELNNIYLTYFDYNPYTLIDRRKINTIRNKKPLFVIVNHTDSKTLNFINFLKNNLNADILFTNKNYSIDKSIEKKIIKLTNNKKISEVSEIINLLNSNFINRDVLVFDLSAIIYNEIHLVKNNQRVYIIEDTKNGIIYSKKQEATRFSIANSLFKKEIENPAVARSIFSASLKYFRDKDIQIDQNTKILIVGIGSIGLNLLNLFSKISHNTYGYDKDYSKLLLANIFNLKTTNNLENISEFDFIFGVTGDKNAISKKYLDVLNNGTYLINCSSGKFEFDSDFFLNKKLKLNGDIEEIEVREEEFIYRINEGYPINFYDKIGTEKAVINTVFAYMFEFISEVFISGNDFEKKTYETDDVNFHLDEKYVEYYYRRFVK